MGPRCNRRVSCSSNPQNDRSESALAINPVNPYHMVGASKKFTNPHTYDFSLIAYYSFDGGQTWTESEPLGLLPPWSGLSDPALTFDSLGNVFLLGLPFQNFPGGAYQLYGMVAYKSTDGGRTWSAPNHIHDVIGDDKQWIAADNNPASPFYGRVYGCWDSGGIGGSQLCFGRTLDHGATWVGIGSAGMYQPTGTGIPGVSDSGSPEANVARDGTIYIVWWNGGGTVKIVKSTDGGDTFSAPIIVANGITPIGTLPGSTFRNGSFATACCGKSQHVVVAWSDYREGSSRIYYRHSPDGGTSWDGPGSGSPMLTGAVATPAGQHDFFPQLACTPDGEVGCAFYEFGPRGGGEFPPSLIDVYLAVSVDNGSSFNDRALVTDQPWDPTVDEVWAHGDSSITFIGDYFGIDASRLGFYPFWTDTRTGVQEIFTSRLSPYPADVYIRDSSTDVGNVPSPGDHWEYVDLIVRDQPDGDVNFVNVPLYHDGVTDFYIYCKARNNGPNKAQHVTFTAVLGNWPALDGLPGSEFRYPQDWCKGDWDAAMASVHQYIGEGTPTTLNNGEVKILGPIVWPAAMIPTNVTFDHPCLLVEVHANNNDSAGGPNSIPVPAEGDKNACNYGSFFWGSNDITQRNLSYGPAPAGFATQAQFVFIAGNFHSPARFVEVVVDKGKHLARVPMTLTMEPLQLKDVGPGPSGPGPGGRECCCDREYIFVQDSHLIIKCDGCVIAELEAKSGTVLRHKCDEQKPPAATTTVAYGATGDGKTWALNETLSMVGFPRAPGQAFKMTLSFVTPPDLKPGSDPIIRILQRNDKKVITGGVSLQLLVTGAAARPAREAAGARKGAAAKKAAAKKAAAKKAEPPAAKNRVRKRG
jgi:hypothetical protein